MANHNAAASNFGWDFQINAGILLFIENIADYKSLIMEGNDEDIEIVKINNKKIYIQAKAIVRYYNTDNNTRNLKGALKTLNDAAIHSDGELYIYLTNSNNPFNNDSKILFDKEIISNVRWEDLEPSIHDTILKIIEDNNLENIKKKLDKFRVRTFFFYGEEQSERYSKISERVRIFLDSFKLDIPSSTYMEIIPIWQSLLSCEASNTNKAKKINKQDFIWPLISIILDSCYPSEILSDCLENDGNRILDKYKQLINYRTLNYKLISKIKNDYKIETSKNNWPYFKSISYYISENWEKFSYLADEIENEKPYKELLIKIIIFKILYKANTTQHILDKVNYENKATNN